MNGKNLFVEVDYAQEEKNGEEICGDSFALKQIPEEERRIVVLSDGLGSGVKANILSCMTAEMAVRFIASDMDLVESVKVIMDVLPVCEVRKISYSTLTVVDTLLNGETRIIEMDNPPHIHLRGNKIVKDEKVKEYTATGWQNRTIRVSSTKVEPEDRIIIFSDGITQAGLGSKNFHLGWRYNGCLDYAINQVTKDPKISARKLASNIIGEALTHEEDYVPHDDMTCAVIYFRSPRRTMVISGPPFHAEQDREYARLLDDFNGKKVICGGTTANIIARELKREVYTSLKRYGDLPPASTMNGIDLVTEGILTLSRTYQLLKERDAKHDPSAASALAELLRESDIIDFYIGTRINEAHQDPTLPRELEIRRNIIKKIVRVLEEQYLKEIHLNFI
ncbi:MAG TPA: SpoIIE family protein phosphatase [Melioribacteraceae bacterium]|nr:SpoIIE family protein phosphatase [Melioribacteraceae bacterium]